MFLQIDDDSAKFGALVSVELFNQLTTNINYLIDSLPIGCVIPVLTGFPGVPVPDSNLWQECNNTPIANPLSPMHNTHAPNYTDEGRYTKNYTSFGDVGNYGGGNIKNLAHSHGGQTEENPSMDTNADTDDDFWTGKNHRHSISSDLGSYNFEPEHIRVKHYIKIADSNNVNAIRFKDMQTDFGTTIAQALWINASKNINSLDKAYPIGMVMYFYATQANLPSLPDPAYWQLLNGSVVTNVNSPLVGQTLPNFSHLFLRHPMPLETPLTTGGSNSINLAHNHGGQTGVTNDRNDFQLDNGGERAEADNHFHTISSDMGTYSTVPSYVELQCYVRIA